MLQRTAKSAGNFSRRPAKSSNSAKNSQIVEKNKELAGNLWITRETSTNTGSDLALHKGRKKNREFSREFFWRPRAR
jgi:hypothetical protein